jgi:hypothetical protein
MPYRYQKVIIVSIRHKNPKNKLSGHGKDKFYYLLKLGYHDAKEAP